jgi:hypothetical protein
VEAVRVKFGLILPDVVASDVAVLPAERRQGGKLIDAGLFASGLEGVDRVPEIDGFPQDDGGSDEVERRCPLVESRTSSGRQK